MHGTVYQLNVKPQTLGEPGLPKQPVESAEVTLRGIVGDYNGYRTVKKKGNPNHAVMPIPLETLGELGVEGWPVEPGHLGENITTLGVPYNFFEMSEQYTIGVSGTRIEITEPCTPCTKLGVLPYVGDKVNDFIKTLVGRRGWYAKVIREGRITQGDSIDQVF